MKVRVLIHVSRIVVAFKVRLFYIVQVKQHS
jgi:hypothetical protein